MPQLILTKQGAFDADVMNTINSNAKDAVSQSQTGAQSIAGSLSYSQPIIAPAATLTLTNAQSGSLVQMGATTGEVVTLPTPVPGVNFTIAITVSNTSNYNEIQTPAGVFLLGTVSHSASGIAPLNFWADGTSIRALKMDGAHLGGLIGSYFEIYAISTTQWVIGGTNLGTATMTTAFTATP
jgi:hypothetical protein